MNYFFGVEVTWWGWGELKRATGEEDKAGALSDYQGSWSGSPNVPAMKVIKRLSREI